MAEFLILEAELGILEEKSFRLIEMYFDLLRQNSNTRPFIINEFERMIEGRKKKFVTTIISALKP